MGQLNSYCWVVSAAMLAALPVDITRAEPAGTPAPAPVESAAAEPTGESQQPPGEDGSPELPEPAFGADSGPGGELGVATLPTATDEDPEAEAVSGPGGELGVATLPTTIDEAATAADIEELDRSRRRAYQEFLDYFDGEHYPEAVEAALRVLELTIQQVGTEDMQLLTPLLDVAAAQRYTGDYAAAEATHLQCIALVESHGGQYSPDLIRPISELGDTYMAAGAHTSAVSAYRRVQHLTHRKDGVYTLEQLDVLDQLTEGFVAMRRWHEADRQQRFSFRVSERNYGSDDPRLVPALDKLARWFQRNGQFANARNLYKRSVQILEQTYGEDDLRLVQPLRGIAMTRHIEGGIRSEGEKALERAYQIVDEHEQSDTPDRVLALVDVGDWHVVSNKKSEGLEAYRAAWQLMESEGATEEEFDRVFGHPVRLEYRAPSLDPWRHLASSQTDVEVYIDLEFSVREDGTVRNIKVLQTNASGALRNDIRFAIRRARYRPRLVDGQPVTTDRVRLRQTYAPPPPEDKLTVGTEGGN